MIGVGSSLESEGRRQDGNNAHKVAVGSEHEVDNLTSKLDEKMVVSLD